jgi:hypothetical protein
MSMQMRMRAKAMKCPDDIRANRKEGDEYDTIGDVLRKGGVRKALVIFFVALLAGCLLIQGLGGGVLFKIISDLIS